MSCWKKKISRLRIHLFEEKKVRKVTRTIVPVPIVNVTGKKEKKRERERVQIKRENKKCARFIS